MRVDGQPAAGVREQGLLGHDQELRAGQHGPDRDRQRGRAQLGPRRVAQQPGQQGQPGHDRRQHRRLLVGEHGHAHDQAQDDCLPAAGRAAQAHRRLQRHRQEHRPERDVHVVPVLLGEHRRQAVERPGGDRADDRGEPQPGGPVHRVTQQSGGDQDQQVVGDAGAEDQGDRRQQQAGQRHQGVEPERDPDRRRHQAGEPGVRQMGHLARHPPEAPDVGADVTRRRQAPVRQVGRERPGDHHPGGDEPEQQRCMPGERAGRRSWPASAATAGRPRRPPAIRPGRGLHRRLLRDVQGARGGRGCLSRPIMVGPFHQVTSSSHVSGPVPVPVTRLEPPHATGIAASHRRIAPGGSQRD